MAGCIYRVGLAMLDLNEPTRVLHRHPDWVFGPAAPYEREGDIPNAVFPCGLVVDEASGDLRLYYGAADSVTAAADFETDEIIASLR